jgi:CxxC-x17-CxxC domain-containing protein
MTAHENKDERVAIQPYPAAMGDGQMQFVDRLLKCMDCNGEFVFTAGEQLFFHEKQFKNDPKRCKLCKARRAAPAHSTNPHAVAALPFSRTETRTECSACGIETTVPFKPTQGRPVLCRSCFQLKRVPSGVAAAVNMNSPAIQVAAAAAAMDEAFGGGPAAGLPLASSTATMGIIAETQSLVIADRDRAVKRPVGNAESLQA